LNIEGFEVYDEGYWTVQVEHKDNNGIVGQETEQFEITSNQKSDLVLTSEFPLTSENGVSGTTDDFMKFTCLSIDGIPHPYRFNWSINENLDFNYRDWSAVFYPMQISGDNSSQILEIKPPAAGTFLLQCESDQDGYYSSKVNLTLKITENDTGGLCMCFKPRNQQQKKKGTDMPDQNQARNQAAKPQQQQMQQPNTSPTTMTSSRMEQPRMGMVHYDRPTKESDLMRERTTSMPRGRMETEFYANPGVNMKMVNNNGRMVGPREPDLVKDRNSSMPRYGNYDNDAYSHSLNRSNVPTYQRPSPIAPSRKKNNESESSEDGVLV